MIFLQNEDFEWNGLPLSQAYDDVIEHDLNGIYKLTFKIPINKSDQHKLIEQDSILKATEHYRENGYNIFRVKFIDKEEDYVQYTAYQILFDVAKKYIHPLSIYNCLPVDALKLWLESFLEPPKLPINYWSDITDKRIMYNSQKKDNDKARYALNVLIEIANESKLDLDFNVNRVTLGRIGQDTQFLYTTNKNITSFSQEENYDEVITRIIATSKFKPEYDKEKLKKEQKAEMDALKAEHKAFNKQLAEDKRQERIQKEIDEAVRRETLKKLNYDMQKEKRVKTMQVRQFKTAEQIESEIRAKYQQQQSKADAQKAIAKRNADQQKAEIEKLKKEQKEEREALNEDILLSVTVDSPFIDDYPEIHEQTVENNDIKNVEDLTAFAESFFTVQNVDKPKVTFKVGLEVLQHEEINLGDTVIVRYAKHDVDERMRVVATKYSPMDRKYIEVTFGDKAQGYASQSNSLSFSNAQSVAQGFRSESEAYFEMRIQKEKENFNKHFDYETGLIKEHIKEVEQKAKAAVEVMDAKFTEEFNTKRNELKSEFDEAKRLSDEQVQTSLANMTQAFNQKYSDVSENMAAQFTLFGNMLKANEHSIDGFKKLLDFELAKNKDHLSGTSEEVKAKLAELDHKVAEAKSYTDVKSGAVTAQLEAQKTEMNELLKPEVVNTNLIKGSSQFTSPFNHEAITHYGDVIDGQVWSLDVANGGKQWATYQDVEVEPNTDYTVSYDAFAKNTTGTAYVPILKMQSKGVKAVPDVVLNWDTRYKQIPHTKSRQAQTFNSGDAHWIRLYLLSDDANNPVYFAKPKIEKGTKATAYSENPNDLKDQLSTIAITTDEKINTAKRELVENLNHTKSELGNNLNTAKQSFADQLRQAREQVIAQANREADSKLVIAKSEIARQINTAKQDSINTATQNLNVAKEKIEDINQKVDNLKIGAVNMLKGSKAFTAPFDTYYMKTHVKTIDGTVYSQDFDEGGNHLNWKVKQLVKVEPNTDYVLSYDAVSVGNSGATYTPIEAMNDDGSQPFPQKWLVTDESVKAVTRNKTRYVQKFNSKAAKYITVYLTTSKTDSKQYALIGNPQLEKGTVATDWSPNIDDIEAQVRLVADSISAKSIEAVRGDIAYLRSNILSANSITADKLLVDTAMIDKIYSDSLLANKITADSAILKTIQANALSAVQANINDLRARMITAGSITANDLASKTITADKIASNTITSEQIKTNNLNAEKILVDQSLINKLFVNDMLSNRIAADWIVAKAIETKSLNAVNANIGSIKAQILSSDSVSANMLYVDKALIDKLMTNDIFANSIVSNNLITEKMKAKALEAVYANVGEVRAHLITAKSISTESIWIEWGFIDRLISNQAFISTLTAKSAFISAIKAIEIDASRIRTGVLQSSNGDIRWDMNNSSLHFYGHAKIYFHTLYNAIYQANWGTCAFMHFARTTGGQYPSIAIGTSGDTNDDSNTGSFSGMKAHTAKATSDGYSEVDIIADEVSFDSHGGDTNTGGWILENFRKNGDKTRAFYGNNAGNFSYELGQDGFTFRTVWTEGLNDSLRVKRYKDGGGGIMSNNNRYGIQISDYGVILVHNNDGYNLRDILSGTSWNV